MSRIERGPEEQRRVLLRKARAFASRGEDHLAELHINHALELEAPLDEVNAALDDLGARHETFTRRDALRRASMLVGAGMLVGPGFFRGLAGRGAARSTTGTSARLTSSTTAGGALEGLFLKLPSVGVGDGSYSLVPVSATGLLPSIGSYVGETIAQSGFAYNVSQSWTTGSVETGVTVLNNSGATAHFTFAGDGTTDGASTTESVTSVTKVGSLLYCSHTWLRVYTEGTLSGDKAGIPQVRLTAQPTIEIIDVEAGKLVANWLGPELEGACRTSLKVSTDGTGVLLATDAPGAGPTAPLLHWFRFEGGTLAPLTSTTPSPDVMVGVSGRDYHWPSVDSPMLGVSPMGVHLYSPSARSQSMTELAVPYGNNRLTPLWQGSFSTGGSPMVSNGGGQLYHTGGTAFFHGNTASSAVAPAMQGSILSSNEVTPPFLVYQGAQLKNVFATAGSNTWLVDNREGVGGVWLLNAEQRPIDHQLAGSYLSDVTTDGTGTYLGALSSLESVLYVLGPGSSVAAFATTPYAALVEGSTL